MPPSARFSKDRRVRRRGDYQRAFDLSIRVKGRYLTILVARNDVGRMRLGIVASRKLGDAVRRNRAKRLIREVFRRSDLPARGIDVVVIPRREMFNAAFADFQADFRQALERSAARLPASADAVH